GGLADVEWTVQLLQLRHAARVEGLRTTRTVEALEAAVAAGILERADADDLLAAWRLAQRLRNAVLQVRGRPSDSLPRDLRDRAGVAYLLGLDVHDSGRVSEDWRRAARRSRLVVERLFWR
ncbi:MAG: bifunctional glutamine-synthetase adenylyltransferase/deadenyltransferase, partial [Actinomycetota bacterium]|nr:bifunctional glutamine-synthetase adenylyltransferase/deadenyltransferase [Actinomycetota bacterium]